MYCISTCQRCVLGASARPAWNGVSNNRSLGKEQVHESEVKVNRSSGSLFYLIARCSFGHFNYHKTGIRDIEHAEIRNDAVNYPCARERKRALAQELGAAIGGSVLHEHQNTSNAGH